MSGVFDIIAMVTDDWTVVNKCEELDEVMGGSMTDKSCATA